MDAHENMTAQLPVRVPIAIYDRLATSAKENERSLSAEVRVAVKRYLGPLTLEGTDDDRNP